MDWRGTSPFGIGILGVVGPLAGWKRLAGRSNHWEVISCDAPPCDALPETGFNMFQPPVCKRRLADSQIEFLSQVNLQADWVYIYITTWMTVNILYVIYNYKSSTEASRPQQDEHPAHCSRAKWSEELSRSTVGYLGST